MGWGKQTVAKIASKNALFDEKEEIARRVSRLEEEITKPSIRSFGNGFSLPVMTILGRVIALEEKFAAVLKMCKVEVERVETKPAHYRARRKRGKK